MAQLLVGERAVVCLECAQKRRVHVHAVEVVSALDGVLVVAFQDHVLHLKARFGHQAQHARVKAASQALVHTKILGRAIRCDDNLLVLADELVHEAEEVLDARLLTNDVLDIVDNQDVRKRKIPN